MALFFEIAFVLFIVFWSSLSWAKTSSPNLYDQQRSNRRCSYLLIGTLVCCVAILGLGFDVFRLGMNIPLPGFQKPIASAYAYGTRGYWDAVETSRSFGFPYATLAAIVAALLSAHFGFLHAPDMVLAACGAREASPKNPGELELIHVVEELSIAAGMPKPKIHVVPDRDLNAFATGTSPQAAHVAVTSGLLDALNREELQGVVAHELSHIRNKDMELMTLVVGLAGAAALISDWSTRSLGHASGNRKGGGRGHPALFLLWLIFALLAPLLSRLMALAVSRRRESLADASAAELTRNPLSLANALEKIHAATSPTSSMGHQGFAHLCIDDPKGSTLNERNGLLSVFFSTHPPIAERIAALRVMAYTRPAAP